MTFSPKLLVVCCLNLAIVMPAFGASFDCARASSRIENAICASSELSELDSRLDTAYKAALAVNTNPSGVRQAQREWLRSTRNQCGGDTCLLTVYRQRIAALSQTPNAQTQSTTTASGAVPSNTNVHAPRVATPVDTVPATATAKEVAQPGAKIQQAPNESEANAGPILVPPHSKSDSRTSGRTDSPRQAQASTADMSTTSKSTLRPSLKSLFDTTIPQSNREEMARIFVAGQYNFADRSLVDKPTIINFAFSADGTYISSLCSAYGEVSERKFETHSGRWSIKEGRYSNNGLIYYGLWLDDVHRPSLLLDRDDGLQFNFSSARIRMLPGNTAKCE